MNRKVMLVIQVSTLFAGGSLRADEPVGDGADAESTAAPAIYDSNTAHLWNRVHRAFFTRPDAGAEGADSDAVDPPLWLDTSAFLKTGTSHEAAIAVLDEFLANEGHALITDPLKRAVMQHDLWAVFDWSANAKAAQPDQSSSKRNLDELRSRLARVIQRLALTHKEIASLPDNLANTVAAGAFSSVFDPAHPRTPFLPGDLLDPKGPWVSVRGAFPGPSGTVHAQYYQGRSPFLVFIRLPGGRKATLDYVHDLNQATNKVAKSNASDLPLFPVGTMAALLRQMTVIDDTGQIQVTPLTQTLQMRVYRQVGTEVTDHENSQAPVKFRMKRSSLFAGDHGGLEAIDWSEPLRVSLLQRNDPYRRENGASSIKTTMQACIACHSCGGATIHSVFTYKQDEWVPGAHLMAPHRLRLLATDPPAESKKTIAWKKERYEWGLLKGLLDSR